MKHTKHIYLWLLTLASGVLLTISFPDKGFTPLVFFAFIPLLWVEDYVFRCKIAQREQNAMQQQDKKQRRKFYIFGYAYLAFLTWNIIVDYWIWFSSPAAILCWTVNALLMTLTFCAFHWSRVRLRLKGFVAYLLLIVYWLAFEYFHFNWDVSFPWLTLGNNFSVLPNWVQWYEYTGVLGGSLWILLANTMVFTWIKMMMEKVHYISSLKKGLMAVGIALLLFIPISYSSYIFNREDTESTSDDVEVIVVQPNIDPYKEQYYLTPKETIDRMMSLIQNKVTSNTRFVVAPESMIQEYMWEHRMMEYQSVQMLKDYLVSHPQITFVTGISSYSLLPPYDTMHNGVRFRSSLPMPAADGSYPYSGYTEWSAYQTRAARIPYLAHNAVIAIDASSTLGLSEDIPVYHKTKLTPAVEIMPFVSYLPFLEKLAIDLGGTVGTLGIDTVAKVFYNAAVPFSDLICYESVYGDYVREFVMNGAQILFISTNDGWWGNTPGHRQHVSFARLRAIETRRDIAQSANTGISCFIDKKGRMFYATDYDEPAAIRKTMQPSTELTFYTKHGDYIGRAMLPSALLLLLFSILAPFFRKIF